jgi:hypothetical protein
MSAIREALRGIRTHNDEELSPTNLRWAATHEALCRSFIFNVLTGLADVLEEDSRGVAVPSIDHPSRALRFAQSQARIAHMGGQDADERAWLDMCALLERDKSDA